MKRLELEINDSIFDTFKNFLELLPKSKIKVKEIDEHFHIPFVSNAEQKEIEKNLRNTNCHVVSRSKVVKI